MRVRRALALLLQRSAPRRVRAWWRAVQGFGVYRFADKYGANVDGYSPIYTPDTWSETGAEYKLGVKGLIAWCAASAPRCLFLSHIFARLCVGARCAAAQLATGAASGVPPAVLSRSVCIATPSSRQPSKVVPRETITAFARLWGEGAAHKEERYRPNYTSPFGRRSQRLE